MTGKMTSSASRIAVLRPSELFNILWLLPFPIFAVLDDVHLGQELSIFFKSMNDLIVFMR